MRACIGKQECGSMAKLLHVCRAQPLLTTAKAQPGTAGKHGAALTIAAGRWRLAIALYAASALGWHSLPFGAGWELRAACTKQRQFAGRAHR